MMKGTMSLEEREQEQEQRTGRRGAAGRSRWRSHVPVLLLRPASLSFPLLHFEDSPSQASKSRRVLRSSGLRLSSTKLSTATVVERPFSGPAPRAPPRAHSPRALYRPRVLVVSRSSLSLRRLVTAVFASPCGARSHLHALVLAAPTTLQWTEISVRARAFVTTTLHT